MKDFAEQLKTKIAIADPDELITLLFQLTAMKAEFKSDALYKQLRKRMAIALSAKVLDD